MGAEGEMGDAAVVDQHRGHAIKRAGHEDTLVDGDVEQAGANLAVPVDMAIVQAKMPFPDQACGVAGLFQHGGQGVMAWPNERRGIAGQDLCT